MELFLIMTAFILAALATFLVNRRGVIEGLAIAAAFVACFESFAIAFKVASSGVYSPTVFFSVDSLGAIVMLIISCIGFATAVYSAQYLRQETAKKIIGFRRVKQYFILLNLFLMAMFFAISANSPIFAWISIEATTLSTAFLISFYNKPSSMEAAWKYLIINSVGLLLGFFGTLLYFTAFGDTGGGAFVSWQAITDNASHLNPLIAKVAFIFVLIGYGTKAGLAPMHTWLPDAHSKAPAPISALLSGALLNVALVLVLRFKIITDASIGQSFSQELLIIFGLLSICIGALIIFTQTNYKRLIAYSSIENMGVMALGFGFGGIGIFGAILHMIYNALTKSALFLSAGTIFLRYSSTKIVNVRGALTTLPVTSILFFAGFFSITGIPPFGVFFTKVYILSAGIQTHSVVAIAALLFMTIVFVGFFKHMVAMVFGEKPADIVAGKENIWLVIPPLTLIAIVLYLSFSLPPFLHTLINEVVLRY
jgi:hydrogenase-4 component F